MTKRRLERAIDEVGEKVLSTLAAEERLQWMLQAQARNKEYWFERLLETCPPEQAPRVAAGGQLLLVWAHDVAYDLHTVALQVELLRTIQDAVMTIDSYREDEPSDERLDRAADRADELAAQFVRLFVIYHSYRRFATEALGVDLETWLALHKNGTTVLELAAAVLDERSHRQLAAQWCAEDDTPPQESIDDPTAVLDPYVDRRYEALVEMWDDLLASAGRRYR